jgi:hypothetical protein
MIKHYDFHKLCCIFPRCSDEELQMLVSDIRENGLKTPIVLFEGKILDGRNRYLACQILDREPRYIWFNGSDPLAFVISHNLCRRHLSESQRALVAAAIVVLWETTKSKMTFAQTAEQFKVSERLVYYADTVIQDGTQQDIDDIMSGEKKIMTVVNEIKEANNYMLSAIDPQVQEIQTLHDTIMSTARLLRKDMDKLFQITQWKKGTRRLYQDLRKMIFDE